MKTDLATQLERYTSAVTDEQQGITAAEAQALVGVIRELPLQPTPTTPASKVSLRRGPRVAAAAAAAVIVLIGGFALLARVQNNTDAPPVVDQIEPEEPPVVPSVELEEPPVVTGVELEEPQVVDEAELEESPVDGDAAQPVGPSRLTDGLPAGLESGAITTPLGTATWVRLTRPVGAGDAITWPSGFAIFQRPDSPNFFGTRPAPVSHPAQLWVSEDGIEWRTEPLPLDPAAQDASLTLVDGVYWLMSWDPHELWRSTDGATWDEYDPSGLVPPGPAGLWWTIHYGPPVTGNGLTLRHAGYEAHLPFHEWLPLLIDDYDPSADQDGSCEMLLKVEPTVFQIGPSQEGIPCLHQLALRFEETESGLRVLDNATGAILGEVPGADLSHIERFAEERDGYIEKRLLIIGDSVITQVEVPWPDRADGGNRLDGFFGTQDWIYAYVEADTDEEQVSVWRTSDGRSWTDLGPSSFPEDGPRSASSSGGPFMARSRVAAWETTDGINWTRTPAPDGRPESTFLLLLESGWFANNGSQGSSSDGDVWWMHVGDTWVSLADLGIEQHCAGARPTSVDNTTTFFFGRGCPDWWILSLNPSS